MNKWKHHLEETGWTYRQHLMHGLHQCKHLATLTFVGLIHSFIPGIWPNKAPLGIYKLYRSMKNLKHIKPIYGDLDKKVQD